MKEIVKKYNPCKSCLCLRCNCLLCPYEKYYSCYPTNAGCVYCMMQNNDKPVSDCEHFKPRSVKPTYRLKAKRKNPYYGMAKLLAALHDELKKL